MLYSCADQFSCGVLNCAGSFDICYWHPNGENWCSDVAKQIVVGIVVVDEGGLDRVVCIVVADICVAVRVQYGGVVSSQGCFVSDM